MLVAPVLADTSSGRAVRCLYKLQPAVCAHCFQFRINGVSLNSLVRRKSTQRHGKCKLCCSACERSRGGRLHYSPAQGLAIAFSWCPLCISYVKEAFLQTWRRLQTSWRVLGEMGWAGLGRGGLRAARSHLWLRRLWLRQQSSAASWGIVWTFR